MNLSGKTILVTRAEQQAGDLSDLIEREGGRSVVFPMIHIAEPENWTVCDQLQNDIAKYDGMFFSSTNAVTGFLERYWDRCGSIDSMRKLAVYAVGEKTASRIRKYGLEVTFIPEQFTANDLAASMTPTMVKGKRFIFPRGNLGSDAIARHILSNGGDIDQVVVYRTLPPEQRTIDLVRHQFQTGQIDAITFTSPSTAKNFFRAMPDFPFAALTPVIAAIGPVTAGTLQQLGHKADIVASPSTMEGLVESLAAFFSANK